MGMTNTNEILNKLNSYTGNNLWQDVVWGLPGYDDEATDRLDPACRSDVIVVDGIEYRWYEDTRKWA